MCSRFWKVSLLLVACVTSSNALTEEISAFKLTEFNGELALRYLYDEQSISNSNVVIQNDIRPAFQQELKLNAIGYVYHPYLINMDLSGGLLLDQSRYKSAGSESSTDEELLNLNARINFLEKKPYPITVFYSQQNPSVTSGTAGGFIQETVRYGIEAALMEPISPVLIAINAYRQTTQGEGVDQIIDDEEERAVLRLYTSFASGAHMELTHQETHQLSNSGSIGSGLVITPRETSRSLTSFDSRNVFGRSNNIQFTTNVSKNTQDQDPLRDEITFTPAVNWKHNVNIDSYYRFNFLESKEEYQRETLTGTVTDTQESDLKKFDTGIAFHTDLFNTSLALQAEDNTTTNVDSTLVGVKYNVSYKKPVESGSVQFNYSSQYDVRDQTASDVATVYGESIVLSSLDLITLGQENIVVSSIRVFNLGRTQEYRLGDDYSIEELDVVKTQIRRSVTGNILDGETVLVDYSYETGGTFAYGRVSNNLNLNWSILSSYDVYFRYSDSDFNLRDGNPTIQLNSQTTYTYGARADKPLLNGIILGGEAYQEEREEKISPSTKQSVNMFIEMPLPNLTNVRFSVRRVIQDNEESVEDTDLTGVTIRILSRPWLRGSLTWESTYENDVGGMQERLVQQHRMRFSWKIRQLSLAAAINYGKEKLGDNERDRWESFLTASRYF